MRTPHALLWWRLAASLALSAPLLAGPADDARGSIVPVPTPLQFDKPQLAALLIESAAFVGAPHARAEFGVSGQGLSVAVLDTGLNLKHVDFRNKVVKVAFDMTKAGAPLPLESDLRGHGTHVAGIVCADGQQNPQGGHTGIAPGAGIVALKVLNDNGTGSFDAIERALDWIRTHHDVYAISVVNMSLGSSANLVDDGPFASDGVTERIAALRKMGIPVVVAAGNSYFNFQAEGMSFPAVVADTISVGAVYDADGGGISYTSGAEAFAMKQGSICPFSQRLGHVIAPSSRTDVFAPGAPVTSTGNKGERGESIDHGTSQAAPIVAGTVLLVQEYYRRVTGRLPTVDELESVLRTGGVAFVDADEDGIDNVKNTGTSFVRIDAWNALKTLQASMTEAMLKSGASATMSGKELKDALASREAAKESATGDATGKK